MATPTGQDASCCIPLTAAPITPDDATELSRKFKALADPTRVRLLSLVAAHEGGEACVCDITEPVGLSQPTVSHHLKILVEAGLLAREQRGTWAFYSVVPGALGHLSDVLRDPTARETQSLAIS
ncbi:helix-turn-helix transcriptional regulator [Aeromicrobium sp. Marseille-Q0843]|uniref:Helix-turn-helix transcriptional regulator n=1 Tax=Aeromicrobium phoceense TaxID=2754045 RepID=A0A838XH32_9ACTN|nr:metalloregulator ArsR/SmtB family transcription factor [Aeromicrobium phoceense]MBA4609157.1 helix-turn-helix transcriptional regulator [Aeromicrobium phoceense]